MATSTNDLDVVDQQKTAADHEIPSTTATSDDEQQVEDQPDLTDSNVAVPKDDTDDVGTVTNVAATPSASTSTASTTTITSKMDAKLSKLANAERAIKELLNLNDRTKKLLEKNLADVNSIMIDLDLPDDQAELAQQWRDKVAAWWRQYLGSNKTDTRNKWSTPTPSAVTPSFNQNWKPYHEPWPGSWPGNNYYQSVLLSQPYSKRVNPSHGGGPYWQSWNSLQLAPNPAKRHVWLRLGSRDSDKNGLATLAAPTTTRQSNSDVMITLGDDDCDESSQPLTPIAAFKGVSSFPFGHSRGRGGANRRPRSKDEDQFDVNPIASSSCSKKKRFKRCDDSSPENGDDEDDEDEWENRYMLHKITDSRINSQSERTLAKVEASNDDRKFKHRVRPNDSDDDEDSRLSVGGDPVDGGHDVDDSSIEFCSYCRREGHNIDKCEVRKGKIFNGGLFLRSILILFLFVSRTNLLHVRIFYIFCCFI